MLAMRSGYEPVSYPFPGDDVLNGGLLECFGLILCSMNNNLDRSCENWMDAAYCDYAQHDAKNFCGKIIHLSQKRSNRQTTRIDIVYDILFDLMLRFVLDTDVIVTALRSPKGASAALIGAALDRKVAVLASVPLFLEYEAKCTSPVHWVAAGLTHEQAHVFVDGLAALIEPVKTYYLWRPTLRDPNDEMVLETAVNGRADAIVTFNVRDYGSVPGKFYIEVLTPATAIRRVKHE